MFWANAELRFHYPAIREAVLPLQKTIQPAGKQFVRKMINFKLSNSL